MPEIIFFAFLALVAVWLVARFIQLCLRRGPFCPSCGNPWH